MAYDPPAMLLKTLGSAPRDAMEILGHSRIAVTLEASLVGESPTRHAMHFRLLAGAPARALRL